VSLAACETLILVFLQPFLHTKNSFRLNYTDTHVVRDESALPDLGPTPIHPPKLVSSASHSAIHAITTGLPDIIGAGAVKAGSTGHVGSRVSGTTNRDNQNNDLTRQDGGRVISTELTGSVPVNIVSHSPVHDIRSDPRDTTDTRGYTVAVTNPLGNNDRPIRRMLFHAEDEF
jgi:hypothetical protein